MKDPRSPSKLVVAALVLGTLLAPHLLEGRRSRSRSGSGSTLALSSQTLDFGTVLIGGRAYLKETLYNRGSSSLSISQASSSDNDFDVVSPNFPVTIAPRSSVDLGIRYTPRAVGPQSGTVTLTYGSGSATFAIKATVVAPGRFVASPASIRFGNVGSGKSRSITETFTNTGSTDVTVSQATVSNPTFRLNGPTLPLTLSPAEAVTFNVVFAPQASGTASGTLSVTSSASLTVTGHVVTHARFRGREMADVVTAIPLAGLGTGQGQLAATPQTVSFTSIKVGSSASKTVMLLNSGTADVSISQVTASGPGFSLSGMGVPMTLSAGQSKTFTVMYSPTAAGNQSGSLTIVSDSANPVTSIPLSSNGSEPSAPGTLTSSLATISFGSVQVGSTKTQTGTLTNTGATIVNVAQANLSGSGFSVVGLATNLKLNPGQSAPFTVTYAPAASGNSSGGLSIVSDASNSNLSLSLSGTATAAPTPGALASSLSALSFGNVQVGSVKTLSGVLTNSGGTPVSITQATVNGTGFSGPNLALPIKLNAGQSTVFTVTYAPSAVGDGIGTVSVVSDASNPNLGLTLSGSATAAPLPGVLVSSLSTISFGSVQVGATKALSAILTNTGGSPVVLSQANVSGAGFTVGGLTFPLTLNANQTVGFAVTYSPFAIGSGNGSISVVSNASNPTLSVSLAGTSVAAPVPAVLSPSLSNLAFGNVQVGTTKSASETLTNMGTTAITVSQASLNGSGFTLGGIVLPLKLTPGQSANFIVTYAPTAAGSSSGTLVVTSDASNSALVAALSGAGVSAPQPGVLASNLSSLSFGSVQVGGTKARPTTLTNTGASLVTVSQANLSGVGFTLNGLYLPLQLDAGESFTFDVVFTPTAAVAANGSLALVSDASNKLANIPLSGSGGAAGILNVGPSSLNFGNVTVGTTKNLTVTLSAANGSVTVSAASLSSGEYTLAGPGFPLTLAAGQTVPLTLTFTPQSNGSASANLTLATNSASATVTETLAGTGVAVAHHEVDLAWEASTSATGYNVYRGATSGGPYAKLSVTSSPSFVNSSVQSGKTYFYVTTALGSSSEESDYSNEVDASIPTP